MEKKYFTVDEANKELPKVKKSVSKLMKLQAAIELLNSLQIEYDDDFQETVQQVKAGKEFHRLQHQFFQEVENLISIGCVPKDLGEGLVDFYSLKEGREILLCWKAGEGKIDHWHDTTSGFAGRRPITELYHPRFPDDEF